LITLRRTISERKLAEEALRLSREHYRAIVENISDVIFEVDSSGVILYFSPAGKYIWGYDLEDIVGKNFIELVHPEDQEILIKRFVELGTGLEKPMVYRLKNKAGEFKWVRTKTKPKIEKGAFIGASGTLIDITDLKQAENAKQKSEEKYRHITENMSDLLMDIDANGLYKYISPSFWRMLGYTPQDLVGTSVFDRVHPEDMDRVLTEFTEGVRTKTDRQVEYRYKHGNGHYIWLRSASSSLFDAAGEFVGAIINGNNITDRKQAEEKLQDTLESLRKAVNTTIQVMISTIEVRDPYTSGHQSRSADVARAIATEMGLPQEQIEGLRMAGSIHDIGKLSIPAEILSKPSKLSEIEFALIKEHSQKGYEILQDVESPWPLAEIVYQHHEGMDGSGYPRNLKGNDILIEARILNVADVVEAMASHRPYRPSLGIDAALNEIEKNRGTKYDEAVVDACLKLFREKGYQLEVT
jgi:PAS domain S-box-containing protein